MDQDQGVGREVRRLREARDWSQTRLAVESGMSVSGVSMIENGHRNLSTVTLAKLARALEVEVRDLFPLGQAPLPDFEKAHRVSLFLAAVLFAAQEWRKSIFDSDIHKLPGIIEAALDLAERLHPGLDPHSPQVAQHEYLPALDALALLRETAQQGISRVEWEADPETTPAGLGVSVEFVAECEHRLEKLWELPQNSLEHEATPVPPPQAPHSKTTVHD